MRILTGILFVTIMTLLVTAGTAMATQAELEYECIDDREVVTLPSGNSYEPTTWGYTPTLR